VKLTKNKMTESTIISRYGTAYFNDGVGYGDYLE
jgi:hypothetical protein